MFESLHFSRLIPEGVGLYFVYLCLYFLQGSLFYFLAKKLKLVHRSFWTAIGVFIGLAALPLMFFAEKEPSFSAQPPPPLTEVAQPKENDLEQDAKEG